MTGGSKNKAPSRNKWAPTTREKAARDRINKKDEEPENKEPDFGFV